ncbi:MAG: RidA family protein [Hyphomicrobiales bacterium]|nr:RidA family protein [Hyphomicrobiales bacterium]MDE2016895.1 RidA family protein [Hyphomicrobiales bacterium]
MPRKLISSGSPFERDYGYSRAVSQGDFVFVAGTTGYDYSRMEMPADPVEQARNVWRTVAAALAEAGSGLADLVQVRTFVTDAAFAEAVLRVQGETLADIRPAAAIYVISGLLKPEMKVEIEAVAMRGRA